MANIDPAQDAARRGAGPQQSGGAVSFANLVGAVLSLALVVGIGVWSYKLLMRDVSGIPVVRALEGPMRVQPESPGGRQADHQGLAVNAVAARGSAEPPADRLILAPRPISLTDEDTAPAERIAQASAAQAAPAPARDPVAEAAQAGSVEAVVAELTRGIRPASTPAEPAAAAIVAPAPLAAAEPASEPAATAEPVRAAVPAAVRNAPGVALSLRPKRRPAVFSPAEPEGQAQIIRAAVASATPLDVDPDSIAVGTRLVQLGAFDTADIARAEWDRLGARFGDYMSGKARVVQQASSGGRTFYRLRAMGFDDLSEARRFCSALVAEGADCIPVVTR